MLQKLNERIQGMVAWIVVILITTTFALFGVDYFLQSQRGQDVEIRVDKEVITKDALDLSYRRNRQQQSMAELNQGAEARLKKQVLDEMVLNLISLQAAKRAGFSVNDDQVDAAILSIPQFQEDGHFSVSRYQQALNNAFFTPDSFKNEVRQGMILNQQRFAFIGTAFALPAEVERFVKLYFQTRDYDYLQIPTHLFIKNAVIEEKDIEAYYAKHKQDFIQPEQVSIDYIELSLPELAAKTQVSDDEISRYYEENANNYLSPAQWKVAHILFALPADADSETEAELKEKAEAAHERLIAEPEKFPELVKTLSADQLSKNEDGVLPWITAGQGDFAKTLANLTQVGQISPAIKTERGYEIFKLLAYKPAKLRPLNELKGQITEQLKGELAQSSYAKKLEQLTDLSYQNPDSLVSVAKETGLPLLQSKLFSQEGGIEKIAQNKQVIQAAFSQDVLSFGNNSEPVQLNNDTVLVLRVAKHVPATQKPLAEVKEQIQAKLALDQAKLKSQELGQVLLAEPKKQTSLEAGLNATLHWQSVTGASRDTEQPSLAINELAFSLAKPQSMQGRSLPNGDFVLVRLQKIQPGDYNQLDEEQQQGLKGQFENNYGLMDYDLYLNRLVKSAKIEKD